MTKSLTRGQAILIAHFAQPTPQTEALVRAMDGRGYSASLQACLRSGYIASTDIAPYRAATESGRTALIEFMTTSGTSF